MNTYRRDPLLDAGRKRRGVIELFLDNHHLSWEQNVQRSLRQPDIAAGGQPVLPQEHPWEAASVGNFSSVLWSEDKSCFRLWYCAIGTHRSASNQVSLAYAESPDGIHWEKPMANRIAFDGIEQTNLVMGPQTNPHGTCILVNQHSDDPAEQYLAYFDSYPAQRQDAPRHGERGTYTAVSPNGLDWTPTLGRPAVSGKSDTMQSVVWMRGSDCYTAFMRGTRAHNAPFERPYGELQRVRYVRASTSQDFAEWSRPVELLRADERDGDPDVHIHEFSVCPRSDQYIGLTGMMRISQLLPSPKYTTLEEAICDVELSTSRDGRSWHRVADRQVFLPVQNTGPADYDHRRATSETPLARNDELDDSGFYHGGARTAIPAGTIDRGTTFHMLGAHLLFDDEKVYMFYGATNRWRKEGHPYSFYLATLPRDRFQAIKPRRLAQPGIVETKPLYFEPSGDLLVNADASLGRLTVELVDFNGMPIAGFEEDRCIPMTKDDYDHVVRWKTQSGSAGLADAVREVQADPVLGQYPGVRVRFYLRQAWLYAVEWPLEA